MPRRRKVSVVTPPHRMRAKLIIALTLPEAYSFILPQWGGVYLLNTVDERSLSLAMNIFAAQIRLLLGLPDLDTPQESIDALVRARILELTQETVHTLDSTVKLARQQTNLRINQDVQKDVHTALEHLDQASYMPQKCFQWTDFEYAGSGSKSHRWAKSTSCASISCPGFKKRQ